MDPNINIIEDEQQPSYNNNNNNNNNNSIVKRKRTKRQRPHSPISFAIATAAEEEDEDEEELDMANCLILLATGACHNLRDEDSAKFTSKILLESPSAGKAGIYVYQCKTCYRTFPSFQALGGHRTSHKKTKVNGGTTSFVNELSDPDETEPAKFINNKSFNANNVYKTSSKVHECSICGAEFNSGQALGGHMRRHRVMLSTRPINTSQSPTPVDPTPIGPGPMLSLSLDLDLNLPAVSESEIVRRQTALVLSTGPAMVVGCHY